MIIEIKRKVEVTDGICCDNCKFLQSNEYDINDCNLFMCDLYFSTEMYEYKKCQQCLDACNVGKE